MKIDPNEVFKCDVCEGYVPDAGKIQNKDGFDFCDECFIGFCLNPTSEWIEKVTATREVAVCERCGSTFTKSSILEKNGYCLACDWSYRLGPKCVGIHYGKNEVTEAMVNEAPARISKAMLGVLQHSGYFVDKVLEEHGKTYNAAALGDEEQIRRSITDFRKEEVYPLEIKRYLDRFVVGQETAKEVLSVAAYNHYKRLVMGEKYVQKSNVMIIGPTGCGKTHLVKTLAKALNVPVALCQATCLTESGYIGEDPSSVVERLYRMSGENLDATQKGIIFIDEIDKIGGDAAKKRDVGGKGVQQALLPIIEGSNVTLESKDGHGKRVIVDTSNILFILGGAFPDMEGIIRDRLSRENIAVPEANIFKKLRNEDFVTFGFIPEFMGRIPVTAVLEEMSVDALKKILVEPEDSIIRQYTKLFEYDSIKLEFEDEALEEVARLALDEHTGARALRTILENALLKIQFTLPGAGVKSCTITPEVIFAGAEPILR